MPVPHRIALLGLALGLSAACGRDAPTADGAAVSSDTVTAVVVPEEVAAFAVAIADLRSRVIPTFGNGAHATSLGNDLAVLERMVSGREMSGGLPGTLERAKAVAIRLRSDATLLPDLDVVLLVLDQIDVAARSRSDLAPRAGDVNEAAETGRQQ